MTVNNCWTRPLEQPFLFGTHSNCREAEQLCKMQINYLARASYSLVDHHSKHANIYLTGLLE